MKHTGWTRYLIGGIVTAAVWLTAQAGWTAGESGTDSLKTRADDLVNLMREAPTPEYMTHLCEMIREQVAALSPDGTGSPEDAAARLTLAAITDYFGQPDVPREGRQQAAAVYASLLTDEKWPPSVRAFLCEQVRRIGGQSEIPVLALVMQDPQTLEAACGAVESIGGSAACEVLRDALARARSGPDVTELNEQDRSRSLKEAVPIPKSSCTRIIKALGVAGCEDAVLDLRAFRQDPMLRWPAREALCALGDAEAADWCFEDLASAADDVARAAVTADLARLAERLRAARPKEAITLARQMASQAYGPCRVAGVLLEAGLIEDTGKRAAWLAERIQQTDAAADPALWGAILAEARKLSGDAAAKPWVKILGDKRAPSGLRTAVVAMLAARNDKTSRKAVGRAAADRDTAVRTAAVSHMDGPTASMAAKVLMQQALNDTGASTRRQAWHALLRSGDPKVRAMAARALKDAKDPQRVELLKFLGDAGAEDQIEAVLAHIAAPDEATATAALKAVAQAGNDGQWDMVLNTLVRENRESVRNAAVDTLLSLWSVLDEDRRRARAEELLTRFNPVDESTAVVLAPLLARLEVPELRAELLRRGFARNEVPESVRIATAKALGRNAPELAPELAAGLAVLPAGTVREAAVDALIAMLRADFGRARGREVLRGLASASGVVSAEQRVALVKTAAGAGMAGIEALVPLLEHTEWAGDAAQVIADMVQGDNRRQGLREQPALDAARKALPLLDEQTRKALEDLLNRQAAEKKES